MRYPNIEAERARHGLTKVALAKELGVCEKTLYNWINTGGWPVTALQKMSEMWSVSIDYLVETEAKQ